MKDKKSIVILYSKGLYDSNALALAESIESQGKDCHVIAVGDDKYTNFGKGKWARRSYIFSIRNARWMYGLYSKLNTKNKVSNKPLKNIKADPMERTGFNKFTYDMTCRYYKVKNILRRYEPEVVLCFTAGVLKSAIKANEQLRMYTTKIYACITDFGLDMRFFNRRCSGYIVQNEDVKKQLVSLGVDESKTYVTSIITPKLDKYSKDEVKKEVGIRNDKPCILLLGGRYGANVVKTALSYLVNYTDNFNIVVLTGGSSTIVSVAKHVVGGDNDSVFVIDSLDDIGKMYSLADIVVATPTTCICAETLVSNTPLVLLKGVGNVEKNNADYLLSHDYAFDGTNKEKLIVAISDIINKMNSDVIDITRTVKGGSMDEVANFILGKASDIFEEKKILLAEKRLDDAEPIDDYLIEELEDEIKSDDEMKSDDNNNKENSDSVDDAIIDEYNE